jgi:hypothetical protein
MHFQNISKFPTKMDFYPEDKGNTGIFQPDYTVSGPTKVQGGSNMTGTICV